MPRQTSKHSSKSRQETQKIASNILKKLNHKGVICLFGDLGAGKTTFTKGLSDSLGIPEMSIKSPTFTYIREYETSTHKIFHADFYRLEGKEQAALAMLDEMIERRPDLIIIEWAEHLGKHLPQKRTDVRIKVKEVKNEQQRDIHIEHHGS